MRAQNNWQLDFLFNINNIGKSNYKNLAWIANTRQLTNYLDKNFVGHKFRCLQEGMLSNLDLDLDLDKNLDKLNIINKFDYLRESGHFLNNNKNILAVYAQVLTDQASYNVLEEKLTNLKDNPIGPTWLFIDDKIIRSDFRYKLLNKEDVLYKRAQFWGMKKPFIARYSDFDLTESLSLSQNLSQNLSLNINQAAGIIRIIEVFDDFLRIESNIKT